MSKQHVFVVVPPQANLHACNYSAAFHTRCSPPLVPILPTLPIRLHALKVLELLPLEHPAIDSHSWLRIAYNRIVCHTTAILATIIA